MFYDITTRSIPAQTNPSLVMVLAAAPEDTAVEPMGALPEKEEEAPQLVPLRKTAETIGWEVKWQGKNKPVLMEKGSISIEITAGKAEYVVDGDMVKQAQVAAELKDGVLFVSNEVFVE